MKKDKSFIKDFLLPELQSAWGLNRGNKRRAFVNLPDKARSTHIALYGGTGAGKTRLLEGMVIQDIVCRVNEKHPRGVCVIDPHGDLFNNLYDRLALAALKYPKLYDLIYIIDPTKESWSVKLDPLEILHLRKGQTPESHYEQLATDFTYLFHDDPNVHVRQHLVSTHLFWTLGLAKRPLTDAEEFLINPEFRKSIVKKLREPKLERYWFYAFPERHEKAMEFADSTLNRLYPLLRQTGITFLLEGPSTIDLGELMNRGAIILVNAPKGKLGDRGSSLFCGLILARLQQEAMARIDIPPSKRRPFAVYCDEFQTYTTDTARQMVAEDRKLGIEFLFATQEIAGLPEHAELRGAIRKVVGNTLCMRIDREDAEVIVRDLFTPDLLQVKAIIENKPVYWSLQEIWEFERRKLTELPNRRLYWKRRGHPVSEQTETLTVKDIEDLENYNRLGEARQLLDEYAFRLAGGRKFRLLPPPLKGGGIIASTDSNTNMWSD